jgi:hypothetical protein
MSLNYDIRECTADTEDEGQWQLCNSLIWLTMTVDLHEISEENLEEWRFRLAVVDILIQDGRSRLEIFNPDVLRSFIGLKTNANNVTRTKWMTRMKKALIDEGKNAVRRMDNVTLARKHGVLPPKGEVTIPVDVPTDGGDE